MFKPGSIGLTFDRMQVQDVQRGRGQAPFKTALARLAQEPSNSSPLMRCQWDALRWRFTQDAAARDRALHLLSVNVDAASPLDAMTGAVAAAQAYAMLFDQLSDDDRAAWRAFYVAQLDPLLHFTPEGVDAYPLITWQTALRTAAGIVLDDNALFHQGVKHFEHFVSEQIHPGGPISHTVDADARGTLWRQLVCVEALVLTAEMATLTGTNLWSFNARGVSVATAAAYLLYYYFYPEKWRWETGLTEGLVKPWYQQHGGFLEMLYRRTRLPDAMLLLKELRPVVDVWMGGLVTLTHGARQGWFG